MNSKYWIWLSMLLLAACNDIIVPDISEENVLLIAPPDAYETNNQLTTFTWEPVEHAEAYNLQIVSPNYDTIEAIIVDTFTASTSLALSLPSGTYEWSVLAQNSAYESRCCELRSLFVRSDSLADLSQQSLIIENPALDFCTNQSIITFNWAILSLADIYVLQVADNNNFTALLINEGITESSYNWTIPSEKTYYWRIRAENESTNTFTNWTNGSFTYDITPPTAPTNLIPSNGDTISINTLFSWQSDTEVEEDAVSIYNDAAQQSLLWSGLIQQSSFNLNDLGLNFTSASTYYWQIQSVDKADNISSFSNLQSFTIE